MFHMVRKVETDLFKLFISNNPFLRAIIHPHLIVVLLKYASFSKGSCQGFLPTLIYLHDCEELGFVESPGSNVHRGMVAGQVSCGKRQGGGPERSPFIDADDQCRQTNTGSTCVGSPGPRRFRLVSSPHGNALFPVASQV